MGGPQRRSLSVAKRLRPRQIETVFLIPDGDNAFARATSEAGFETHRISFSRIRPPSKILENIRFVRDFIPTVQRVRSIITENNIDAVHANMAVNFQTTLGAACADVPLAWHFNDTLVPTPVKQGAALLATHMADEIVVAADAVAEYYFSSAISTRTIYAPVDLNEFDPTSVTTDETALREDLGIPQSCPIVGVVGNLNPIKGHEYLLRAVATVLEEGHRVAVPIVGAELDSRRDYSKKLYRLRKELDLEDQVVFTGFRSDIPELLSLFDVFVLPSVAEACPIVVLEAMAMKCPVVATSAGGVPEEIPSDEYGWIVPPKDSQALANAIKHALNNPDERRHRADKARDRVEEMFSLTACVARHENLYRSLVE